MKGTIGWALTSALPCWVSVSCLALERTILHECGAVCIFCFPDVLFSDVDAALDRDTEGDLLLGDMGQGIPFKPGSFDGCIR